MARENDNRVIRTGIELSEAGVNRVFVSGQEDELEKLLTPAQVTHLLRTGAIAGDWSPQGEDVFPPARGAPPSGVDYEHALRKLRQQNAQLHTDLSRATEEVRRRDEEINRINREAAGADQPEQAHRGVQSEAAQPGQPSPAQTFQGPETAPSGRPAAAEWLNPTRPVGMEGLRTPQPGEPGYTGGGPAEPAQMGAGETGQPTGPAEAQQAQEGQQPDQAQQEQAEQQEQNQAEQAEQQADNPDAAEAARSRRKRR